MDHILTESHMVLFDTLNFRHAIRLPVLADRIQYLKDISLMLHSFPDDVIESHGLGRLNISLNDQDITPAIIEALRQRIRDANVTEYCSRQYEQASETCIKLMDRIAASLVPPTPPGVDDMFPDRDSQKKHRKKILSIKPFEDALKSLGDPQAGWHGNLHVLNYLYSHIKLEPLSLNEIWQLHAGSPDGWKLLPEPYLTFSVDPGQMDPTGEGQDRIYPDAVPEGKISCRLVARYRDPLDDRVTALEKDLAEFKVFVKNKFDQVDTKFKVIDGKFEQIDQKFKEVDARLADFSEQLDALGRKYVPRLYRFTEAAVTDFLIMTKMDQPLAAEMAGNICSSMEDTLASLNGSLQSLNDEQRQALKDRLVGTNTFQLAGFSSFANMTEHFPRIDTPVSINWPHPGEIHIELPTIPIPSVITDVSKFLEKVGQKIGGLAADVFETLKEIIVQLPAEIVNVLNNFVDRMGTFAELIKEGKVDQAVAELFKAVVYLARDTVALVLATVLNLVVDVVAGALGGLLLARPMSQAERDFVHSIFGGAINLSSVRIAVLGGASGLRAADIVYVSGDDLSDAFTRGLYAHEFTHVYQDQHLGDPATLVAAGEFLNHHFGSGRDPYKVTLAASSHWNDLGVEQQAQVVQNWQNSKDGILGTVPVGETKYYKAVLQERGLFGL